MHAHSVIFFNLQWEFVWRQGPDLPFGISGPVQSVVINKKVFVGGGHVDDDTNKFLILEYDTTLGKWSALPPYRMDRFAMAAVKNELLLAGGYEEGHASKILGVWKADINQWTQPYPEMHTARCSCSAAACDSWLVVAGGFDDGALCSVEVLNTDTEQWYAGPPLPVPLCEMKTVVVGDMYVSMGGLTDGLATDNVFYVSIQDMIHHITSQPKEKTWKIITGLTLKKSAPLAVSGSLLAVGGKGRDSKTVTAIHHYQPHSGKWVKVGDLPSPRYYSTCSWIASSKEIIVAGGWDNKERKRMKRVNIASMH